MFLLFRASRSTTLSRENTYIPRCISGCRRKGQEASERKRTSRLYILWTARSFLHYTKWLNRRTIPHFACYWWLIWIAGRSVSQGSNKRKTSITDITFYDHIGGTTQYQRAIKALDAVLRQVYHTLGKTGTEVDRRCIIVKSTGNKEEVDELLERFEGLQLVGPGRAVSDTELALLGELANCLPAITLSFL